MSPLLMLGDYFPLAGSSPPHATLFGEEDDSVTYADRIMKSATVTNVTEYEIAPALIAPRYNCQYMSVETYVLDVIRDQLSRRQPMDGGSRNLVRTMMVVCGYSDIRMLAAHRLEMWLQNPKVHFIKSLFSLSHELSSSV